MKSGDDETEVCHMLLHRKDFVIVGSMGNKRRLGWMFLK
jgi:hypothetical protein